MARGHVKAVDASGGLVHGGKGVGDAHIARLQVFVDALEAALPAKPRLLDSTKRCCRVRDDARIHSEHAHLEILGQSQRTVKIEGKDVPNETEFGVIS